jgi:hypothetical protein
VPASALGTLCKKQEATLTGIRYSQCKASAVAAENRAVFEPVNAWLLARQHAARTPLLAGTVSGSDGVAGVAKGNDCGFSTEPFIVMFINSYLGGSVTRAIVWAGLDTDEITTNSAGLVTYLHAGDWSTGSGGTEVNFPGVTDGTLIEGVYGESNKFVICKLN